MIFSARMNESLHSNPNLDLDLDRKSGSLMITQSDQRIIDQGTSERDIGVAGVATDGFELYNIKPTPPQCVFFSTGPNYR